MAEVGISLAMFAGFFALLLIGIKKYRRFALRTLLGAAALGYFCSRNIDWDTHTQNNTASSTNGPFMIDTKVRLKSAFYGCSDQQALDLVLKMLREGDTLAMSKAAMRGGCSELEVGDEGVISDTSIFHGSTCMRRRGEPDCLWVPTQALEQVGRATPPT